MSEESRREVRAGLEPSLARLWRYALVLSRARDIADDLVQATCLRAIERADQFVPGTRVDRWLLAILRSIWLNEVPARRIREGGGCVAAEDALTSNGAEVSRGSYMRDGSGNLENILLAERRAASACRAIGISVF